jgi:hypothetical protein
MKTKIAYWISYLFFNIGDVISKCMLKWNLPLLYKPYQLCMRTSLKIQLWAGLEKPWQNPE